MARRARAGLKKGDVVVAIERRKSKKHARLADYIKNQRTVDRPDGRAGWSKEVVKVTPEVPEGDTSANWNDLGDRSWYHSRSVWHDRRRIPGRRTDSRVISIFNTVGAIASPKSDVKLQHMSGPVMMLKVYYDMFERRWLADGTLVQCRSQCESCVAESVADSGAGWRHIRPRVYRSGPPTPGQHAGPRSRPTGLRGRDHWFMVYIAFFDVQDLFGSRMPRSFRREPRRRSRRIIGFIALRRSSANCGHGHNHDHDRVHWTAIGS